VVAVCKPVGYPTDFSLQHRYAGDVCQEDRACLPNAAPSRNPGSADEPGAWYTKRRLELGKREWARRIGVYLGTVILAAHEPAPVRVPYPPQELRDDPTARGA